MPDGGGGATALRTFRLFRLLRFARKWEVCAGQRDVMDRVAQNPFSAYDLAAFMMDELVVRCFVNDTNAEL